MRYESPEFLSGKEIREFLSRDDLNPNARIKLVLSAIYFGETNAFAGDVIIEEFQNAKYKEKIFLKNIFETFYGMRRTVYRIDDSISLLKTYAVEENEHYEEIKSTIDALLEYKEIFSRNN